MFKRRRRDDRDGPENTARVADVYDGLRRQILRLDPAEAGMPGLPATAVWGGMMETAYPTGIATLVCLADGTTSLYTSTGGGMIGAGTHESVRAANQGFLASLSDHVRLLDPESEANLPEPGHVVIRALIRDGHRAALALEEDLGYGRHDLSPVFHAAQGVITELRQIETPPEG